jgi:putative ABC transport system permease protein
MGLLFNILRISLRALNKNKLRTALTMLGIIIGVASVVAMMGIGQGSSESIKAQVNNLGTNMIIIFPASTSYGGVASGAGTSQNLSVDDATAIPLNCPSITMATPIVRTSSQVLANGLNWRTQIYGSNPDYFPIKNLHAVAGDVFSDADNRNAAKVCLIGQTVIKNLWGAGANPQDIIGQSLRITNIPFKIVGVLEIKGQNSFGQDQDDVIIAPFTTVQRRILSITWAQQIIASAKSPELIQAASDEVNDLLMQRHKTLPGVDPDFTIRTQADLSNAFSKISNVMSVLLLIIASISLLVGGIGIMNIMLVSITERTKEIGLRMAIGAKGSIILLQFLTESVVISFIGGFIGILVGYGIAQIVKNTQHWPIVVSGNSILIAFLSAAAIGIFFGFYPARKASLLNPIEALRYE